MNGAVSPGLHNHRSGPPESSLWANHVPVYTGYVGAATMRRGSAGPQDAVMTGTVWRRSGEQLRPQVVGPRG